MQKYIERTSDIYFGLTPKEIRQLALEFARKLQLKYPDLWNTNEQAGQERFSGFLKRHPGLSIRRPEATSMARATSFNENNVNMFIDNLISVLKSQDIGPGSVWNMNETGITTVQRPERIVARRGRKQVGAITSQERGELFTVAMTVSALGNRCAT